MVWPATFSELKRAALKHYNFKDAKNVLYFLSDLDFSFDEGHSCGFPTSIITSLSR